MTNEEKAQELAIKYCKEIDPHGREVYNIGCGIACCEMAEWKEQQMINKACEWLKNNTISVTNDTCTYTASSYDIGKEEFIEDFKKAMEE